MHPNRGIPGLIDSVQMDWLRDELKKTDVSAPLVVSTHIPFLTAYTQKYDASTLPNDSSLVVVNARFSWRYVDYGWAVR